MGQCMNNCMLRELGFDSGKEPSRRKLLDDYIREKIRARYPEARRIKKTNTEVTKSRIDSDLGDDYDEGITHGRLSRIIKKKKKFRTITAQTLDEDEAKSRSKSFDNLPTGGSYYTSPKKSEFNRMGRSENKYLDVSQSPDKDDREIIKTPPQLSRGESYNNVNATRGVRLRSEYDIGPLDGLRRSASGTRGTSSNMFNGIERINFKEMNGKKIPTGRAKHPIIKGFENKYFRISKVKSQSPEESQQVFDDDDEDFPYDYYE